MLVTGTSTDGVATNIESLIFKMMLLNIRNRSCDEICDLMLKSDKYMIINIICLNDLLETGESLCLAPFVEVHSHN